ncbi:hypothetical protein [Niabella ginsengisoli]|uniref:N-sulphoglucosamine sulphohydrolase C-terminal domain-containing protein n=1 Tax=Niabella ginsengisoli TaxID=522298 RepID=A0ABS9SIU0_9BACT|nr:hypothetical protein [Niabella ginsengisoli]MCH5598240.1 hypothetical protein [Niabella ginsengisoli]
MLDGGRDKLTQNNSIELYNLKDDLSETKNLANFNPAKRDELLKELFKIMEGTGAKMPDQKNPLYKK